MVGDSPNAKRTGDIITMGVRTISLFSYLISVFLQQKNRSDKAKAKKEKLKQVECNLNKAHSSHHVILYSIGKGINSCFTSSY